MFGFMAGEVMVQAAVLSLILYFVARHEADYSISKVAMVVAGLTLGTFVISALAEPHIGRFTILANLAFICFMLMTFCWITLWKSILVVALYSCFYVAMFFVGQSIKDRISQNMNPSMVEQRAQDIDEVRQELLRQQQMFAGTAGAAPNDVCAPTPSQRPGNESLPGITVEENTNLTVVVKTAPPAPVVEPTVTEVPSAPPVEVVPAESAAVVSNTPPPVAVATNVPTTPLEDAVWAEARKKLKIGGAVKGKNGKWTAFVNNSLVEVGDVVSARYDGTTYRWKVRTITGKGLTFDPLDNRPQK